MNKIRKTFIILLCFVSLCSLSYAEFKYNPFKDTDPSLDYYEGVDTLSSIFLLLDQTTPQDVINGQPDFLAGFRAGATNQLSVDNVGNLTTTGTGTFSGLTSNANISIKNGATGSGIVSIYEDSDDGSNYASFQVPALAANTVYTLPPDDGDAGEQLQTDGAGVLTWEAAGAGGGGDSVLVNGTAIGDAAGVDLVSGDVTVTLSVVPSPDTATFGIAADAVDDTHIDWGSGASQVDLADIPGGAAGASAFDFGGATSVEVPNIAGDVTCDAAGEIAIDSTNKQLCWYDGTNEIAIPGVHILQGNITAADYDVDSDVWIKDLHADRFPNGIYITKIYVDANVADPDVELNANLMYCDNVADGAFPGANATLIKAIDTVTGNFADAAVNTAVAAGKSLYIDIDVDPATATNVFHVRIHYRIEED